MAITNLDVSVAFAPAFDTPDHIALAEQLGFKRAWCYDAPAVWADVWMTLARAADRTRCIELGTAVLIPAYRTVMATAAAIATLEAQAPGRVVVGVGVGHGNKMVGGGATSWQDTADYIKTLRALLRGEEVSCDGKWMKMLHNEGFAARRPADIPFVVAAQGPKGMEIARTLCDGVISAGSPAQGFKWASVLLMGTVVPDDGKIDPDYLMQAAGHAAAAAYHATYHNDPAKRPIFSQLPNAGQWAEELEKIAPERRHLVAWAKHLVGLTAEDKVTLTPDLVRMMTFTGTSEELRGRLAALQSAGASEVIYQPAGSDIAGELKRFATMAGLQS